MNLSQCLLYRDIDELSTMADLYDCMCNRNSKLDLVQSLHFQMFNKDYCRQLFTKLDKELLYYSTYILFQPTRFFTINQLVALGKELTQRFSLEEGTSRKWVLQLMKQGWLFPHHTLYQTQLVIPSDLLTFLREQLSLYWLEQIPVEMNQEGLSKGYVDEGEAMLTDLLFFLKEVLKEPLPLTIEGCLHKNYQKKLFKQFQVAETVLTEQRYRFGYGRRFPNYPDRFALIYDYCFSKQYILEQDAFLSITHLGESFIHHYHPQQSTELRQELVKFWLKTYKYPIPNLPFIYTFLSELIHGRVLNTADLFTLLSLWIHPYYFDDQETVYRQRILKMMLHLGLIRISFDQQYVTLKNSL